MSVQEKTLADPKPVPLRPTQENQPPAPASPPLKKSRKKQIVLGLLLLALLVYAGQAGTRWLMHDRFFTSTDDAYVTADISQIAAKVSGYVSSVDVKANQKVKAGDVLLRLEDGDYKIAVAAAIARVAAQTATIERISQQIEAARRQVDQAIAQKDAAEADLVSHRATLDRQSQLRADKVTSQSALDQAKADHDRSIAAVKGADAAIAVAKADVQVLIAQQAEASRQKDVLQSELDRARRDLEFTVIKAPVDGIIGNRAVQPGNYVQTGARLMALVPTHGIHLDANFKETQIEHIQPGQTVEIKVDAFPDTPLTGTVESIAPATGSVFSLLPPDNATGNFTKIIQRVPVRITVPDSDLAKGLLRPGLSIKRHIVSPVIGLVATLAPTLGPTIGGSLSDAFSWHWLFFINVVPGIFVTLAAWNLIDFDEPNLSLFDDFDWFGLAAMAIFLGSLEYILEEGPNHEWLADESVRLGTCAVVIAGVAFFWRVLTAAQPIVSLAAFRNRNFAAGSLFSFVLGIGLYGLTYLYPIYLGRIRGYSALQIGETLFLTGICMFITAPIAGRLAVKFDPRALIGLGFINLAISCILASSITSQWGFAELVVPQIFRGSGLMLCMVAINNVALGALPPEMIKNASGLFNLTRNFGGAVGLAIINTALNARWDLHIARLHERVTWGRPAAEETLNGLAAVLPGTGGENETQALKLIANMARAQGFVLSFADLMLILAGLFALLVLLLPFIERPKPVGAGH